MFGMDSSSGNRKFEITYTVTNIMNQYNDCQEFYWQFLAKGQNAVPADKVTGKITLPVAVSNIENLKVWAHGEVNGEINRVDNKTVAFNIDRLSPRAMVEIRVVTTESILKGISANKTGNYSYFSNVLREEEKWANETNEDILMSHVVIGFFVIIEIILIIVNIFKIIKLKSIAKEKEIETHDLKYYRDIPRENNSTPAEALYLSKFDKKRLDTGEVQQKTVASIILDLCLKKKIRLSTSEKTTKVKIIAEPEGLKKDELEVYKLLKKAGNSNEEFDIADLNKYAKKKYDDYSNSINSVVNSCRNSLYDLKLIDKAKEKNYLKGESAETKYAIFKNSYIWLIIAHIIAIMIPFFRRPIVYGMGFGVFSNLTYILIGILPLMIIKLYYWKKQGKILGNISVITQAGNDEKEQWLALKNYLEDYSLLKEKDIPDLVLWEKYLVYATAFGISEEVIKNMKASYPEVFVKESWDDEKMSEYPLINYVFSPYYLYSSTNNISPISSLSSNVSKAYHTSMTEIAAHAASSGGGGRRRLLWWRRWPVVAGGRNGRKIKLSAWRKRL